MSDFPIGTDNNLPGEFLHFGDLDFFDGKQVAKVPATSLSLRPNDCLFARRFDLVTLDVGLNQYTVNEGTPALFRPQKPDVGPGQFGHLALVKIPSRWGSFWNRVWWWLKDLWRG